MKKSPQKPKRESKIDLIARNLATLTTNMAGLTNYVKIHTANKEDIADLKERVGHVEKQNDDILISVHLIEKGSIPYIQERVKKLEHQAFKTP